MFDTLRLIGVVPLLAFAIGAKALWKWFKGGKPNAHMVWEISLLPFSLPSIGLVTLGSDVSKIDVGYSNYFIWSSAILIFSLIFWIADFQRGSLVANATFGSAPVRSGIPAFLAFAKVLIIMALFMLMDAIIFHYTAAHMFSSPCNGTRCEYYKMLLGNTETVSPVFVVPSIFNTFALLIGARKLVHILIGK